MGIGEILVVVIIALIFLGPEKIPKTAHTLGKWFYEIKSSLDSFKISFEEDMKRNVKKMEKPSESVSASSPSVNNTNPLPTSLPDEPKDHA
ncbi:MAG: twin-arginine translocase TatA/TatE family subunit [Deltaproteobacteria bacterium]|nr:twin-arginine translocase TatA/TatE family subunit [Deltaproteobacteria bacterium]